MTLLGTPLGREGRLNHQDLRAMRHCSEVLASGFPLVAFLQIVRVYAQSIRRIADTEVRLFHLYVHEPLMQDEVPPLEMAEEIGDLAADLLPVTAPLMEYMHNRYLRFYIEQDVIGHMETDVGSAGRGLARVSMAFCFVDLTGFTRYTEEEGDEEALDLIERFVDTVEATLPAEAQIVKTIGDEVMVVSPDAATLTEWAVGFLQPVPGAPAAAGRPSLRCRRLPGRRLLRRRRQSRPPGRHPRARRRGHGHGGRARPRRGLAIPALRGDRRGQSQGVPPPAAPLRRGAVHPPQRLMPALSECVLTGRRGRVRWREQVGPRARA